MSAIVNNKTDAPMRHYLERYRQSDPIRLAQSSGAPFDAQAGTFSLTLLHRPFLIGFPEFSLQNPDGSPANDRSARTSDSARLLLIRYLLTAKAVPGTGRFLSYREMPWGSVYDANFQGRCIKRLAFSFGPRLPALARAASELSATPVSFGDAGYELPFLAHLTMRIAVWSGDDEFPPSSQILFSDNFPLAFSAEDMAVVGDVLIGTLSELSR